ncbi:MAG: hypothetical protein ACYCXP_00610 [Leptospirillum sp.]|nr:hypothetical protein [Nitrospiraceae bacterium]
MVQRRVVIDGMRLESDLFGGNILESIDEIMKNRVGADRIISRITLDDRVCYENGEFLEKPEWMESGVDLEIETESLEGVLRDSVMSLLPHLSQIIQLFSEIGRNLRKGDVDKVFQGEGSHKDRGGPYVQGIEAMVTAQILVDRIRAIQKENPMIVSDSPLELVTEESRFQEILAGMLSCQENQDWILLADMLEYELIPVFSKGLSSAEHYLHTMCGVVQPS